METVLYSIEEGIAQIRLDRPDRLNAMVPQLAEELCMALEMATRDGAGAAMLAGGKRAFCAGHDLKQVEEAVSEAEERRRLERVQDVTRLIRRAPFPVVAAVRGWALGGGCELALCSDLVVAADDAMFGFPEVGVGLSVTGGISHVLPAAVGLAKAKELVLLGRRFTATEAASLGLVNAVVPSDEVEPRALEMATELASRPRHALALAKFALDRGAQVDLETALEGEVSSALTTRGTPEAVRAAEEFRQRSVQRAGLS
ncbi:MAG: enoyl-CoA hydratase/isomerase family protein [Acidimicrobiales bacterium]